MRSTLWFALLAAVLLQSQPAAAEMAFTPVPENDPDHCRDLWKDVGLPQYARRTDRDALIVCHKKYVLSHNNDHKTPDWVFEKLEFEMFRKGKDRPDTAFKSEKSVPKEKAARDDDYAKSGFDRGHQAPSADFASDEDDLKESFILSNVVPQQGVGFNQHIWKNLEEQTRNIAKARGLVYVITGPINRELNGTAPVITADFNRCGNEIKLQSEKQVRDICEAKNREQSPTCGEAAVKVPVGMFKIIYDPDLSRVNAYIMPNINHRDAKEAPTPAAYLKKFQVTVHVVERFTGLEFFRDLPTRQRNRLTLTCGQMMTR